MKVMIRRSPEIGLSIYVPKKDLEEPIVEFGALHTLGRLDPYCEWLGVGLTGNGGRHVASYHDKCAQARRRGIKRHECADTVHGHLEAG